MNKTAIKKFAIDARNKLIASVSDRAGMIGITPEECSEAVNKGADFEVYKTSAGTEVTLNKNQCEQRKKLVAEIKSRGFEAVVEEVAYTWFNRICAIRFMEVNDYLPTRVRVLSSEKAGKSEPDLVTVAPDVDLDFTDKEKEYVLEAKMDNRLDELFKMLFIKQCNKLHEILPELFEATEDYTEMLLNISYTNKDDIIRMLVDESTGIPEADFNVSTVDENGEPTGQVEIIGWLYQYYNTELKDDTFAKLKKNVKITKERIPAATQLFTPDWIVRYMVENSVGRLWIEHLRALDSSVNEKETAENYGWKYYLPEAEQEDSVNIKLAEIRTSYKDLTPVDIKCIDPCMGSGHILIAMFDVLMDIYKSAGYSERDAAFYIVENNIHGLDIDKRAYQLAYFAVMMKGRGYNRRFFRGRDVKQEGREWTIVPNPSLHAIKESNALKSNIADELNHTFPDVFTKDDLACIQYVRDVFLDAREYGSILDIDSYCNPDREDRMYASVGLKLYSFWAGDHEFYLTHEQDLMQMMLINEVYPIMSELLFQAQVMSEKYSAVITNPPYMGSSGMNEQLSNFTKKNYPDTKSDMSTVFMEKAFNMTRQSGYFSMINIPVWMFLSSYHNLRNQILETKLMVNLLHLGRGVFGADFGTTAFVMRNKRVESYICNFRKLYKRQGSVDDNDKKIQLFLDGYGQYYIKQDKFEDVPGKSIAYSASDKLLEAFVVGKRFDAFAEPKQGLATADNNRFLRLWYEVNIKKIALDCESHEIAQNNGKKWFPYNKGGGFKKWYGNNEYLINWENDGQELTQFKKSVIRSPQFYFKPCLSWCKVTISGFSMRYIPKGFLFDVAGCSLFLDEEKMSYVLGFANSKVNEKILSIISPTVNYEVGHIASLPLIVEENTEDIEEIVSDNIKISKTNWDSYETSWDFDKHPLIGVSHSVEKEYERWKTENESQFLELQKNEEYLNKRFIKIYGLGDEMRPEVASDKITLKKADRKTDIISLISYAVGCMFGRYSLNKNGIVFAGGDTKLIKNSDDILWDEDNIIPITDEEYFQDDIVGKFCDFVRLAYGKENVEKNLDYIANSLNVQANSSREALRKYFLDNFYFDHCSTYSVNGSGKRPIYWLFDSGKENGFKALVYLHRYNEDTVGRIRTDYLHTTQVAIESALRAAQYIAETTDNGTEKSKATKSISKYIKQLAEIKLYDEAMAHIASKRIEFDLDDGVKVNYEKFQGIEVAQEGKKAIKIDLLAKIK